MRNWNSIAARRHSKRSVNQNPPFLVNIKDLRKMSIASMISRTVGAAFLDAKQSELIDWKRARFQDKTLEQAYGKHVIDHELPKDRLINFAGIAIYYLFGVLDLLTFHENLVQVLILRWAICGPIAIFIVSLSFFPKYRRFFMLGTASVMLIGAFSIVAMIGMAPIDNPPPYIVGIFAVFILFACLQRMDFRLGLLIYLVSFAAWTVTVTLIAPRNPIEIYSGLFFFTWTTLVAVATSYIQEIRSRLDYHSSLRLAQDAEYIQELLIEATAADKSKMNFLSILSHELRTPLHQIIGFTEVLQSNPEDKAAAHLEQIHNSAIQLLQRISKMLRYADATAGTIRYDSEKFSPNELIDGVLIQCRERASKAGIIVNANAVSAGTLYIDATHTTYALLNIVENAISASSRGQCIIIGGQPLPAGGYEITVADAGRGMTEDQINTAFKPFSVAQDLRSRSLEGIGLGLTLANKILADQGAKLTLKSEVGCGTKASIKFPKGPKETSTPVTEQISA
ncbi:MAG: HAMP domain-containing sensor histidine kinase [Parvularculaceae bacterium]